MLTSGGKLIFLEIVLHLVSRLLSVESLLRPGCMDSISLEIIYVSSVYTSRTGGALPRPINNCIMLVRHFRHWREPRSGNEAIARARLGPRAVHVPRRLSPTGIRTAGGNPGGSPGLRRRRLFLHLTKETYNIRRRP
jgi:hypothetical protein